MYLCEMKFAVTFGGRGKTCVCVCVLITIASGGAAVVT